MALPFKCKLSRRYDKEGVYWPDRTVEFEFSNGAHLYVMAGCSGAS